MDKAKAAEIVGRLSEVYEDKPALQYTTPFELLVAVVLSAQCTDNRVNQVTQQLFQVARTPEEFCKMPIDRLEKMIYSCGFYREKAKHIKSAAEDIVKKFGGEVPANLEELQTLAGVGRKTANVVYSVAFGGDAIAVDTHVFRVSARIGLASGENVLKTEKQLNEMLEQSVWSRAHHYLIYHGRNVCKSQKPRCGECPIRDLCEWQDKQI